MTRRKLVTVRISTVARSALNEVSARTIRPYSWLIQEAVADLARAHVVDGNLLSIYTVRPERGDAQPVSIDPSEACRSVLDALSNETRHSPAAIGRAAWMWWLDTRGVEAIVDTYGEVRPRTGGTAS